jgi:hypothetical protein
MVSNEQAVTPAGKLTQPGIIPFVTVACENREVPSFVSDIFARNNPVWLPYPPTTKVYVCPATTSTPTVKTAALYKLLIEHEAAESSF